MGAQVKIDETWFKAAHAQPHDKIRLRGRPRARREGEGSLRFEAGR
jgi:hypothetical protein